MTSDPRELVEHASQGDAGALDALLVRYLPDLQVYVARHAGELVRGQESTDDLAQSVCREALESLRRGRFHYQGEAPFRQWLYRAAVMKMMTRHRRWRAARRDPGREVRADATHDDRSRAGRALEPATLTTPSVDAVRGEDLELFQRAFERLSERHQEVIELHHVEGLSHAEIAARLEISEPGSRMLLSRALARLATLAAARGPTPP